MTFRPTADESTRKQVGLGGVIGSGPAASQLTYANIDLSRKHAPSYASLGLKSGAEWKAYCKSGKKPDDIPTAPSHVLCAKRVGLDLGDWLGTGRVATHSTPISILQRGTRLRTQSRTEIPF